MCGIARFAMAGRDISKYIVEVTDAAVWHSFMDQSDEKLFGM
jgi:hypothetical protein